MLKWWNSEKRSVGSGRSVQVAIGPQDTLGDLEGLARGGKSAVDRCLQQDLLDLGDRAAVPDRALDVMSELGRTAQGGEHREIDDAAGLAVDAVAGPDPAEADFFGVVLDDVVERVAVPVLLLDVAVAHELVHDAAAGGLDVCSVSGAHVVSWSCGGLRRTVAVEDGLDLVGGELDRHARSLVLKQQRGL